MGIVLKFEKREVSSWVSALAPYASIPIAFLVMAIALYLTGYDPLLGFTSFFRGAFLSQLGLVTSLARSTAFLLMAVGIGLALNAGVLNIGGEGQYIIGAIVATAIVIATQDFLPLPVSLILALIGSLVAGALWALVAGVLKAYMGVNEVITTIMMNVLAFRLLQWVLRGPLKNPLSEAWPMSPPLKPHLPELVPGTTFNIGFPLALLVAILTQFILYKTTIGYKIRITGANVDAALYGGINVKNIVILAFMYSGALCGLAGAVDILGVFHFLYEGISIGLGYTSVVVALVGRSVPVLIIPASLMFGCIYNGFTHLQSALGVSYTLSKAIEGVIYLVILVIHLLIEYRVKVLVR
jgi:simple sugar transport system permease protein